MEKVGFGLALRRALDDPNRRAELCEHTGWKDSDVSRIKSGQQGVKIEHLDGVMRIVGVVGVEPAYMDFLAYGCQVGASCRCAREGKGACGV